MPVKLSPVAFAILAALVLSAPILAIQAHHDLAPELTPAIAIQR